MSKRSKSAAAVAEAQPEGAAPLEAPAEPAPEPAPELSGRLGVTYGTGVVGLEMAARLCDEALAGDCLARFRAELARRLGEQRAATLAEFKAGPTFLQLEALSRRHDEALAAAADADEARNAAALRLSADLNRGADPYEAQLGYERAGQQAQNAAADLGRVRGLLAAVREKAAKQWREFRRDAEHRLALAAGEEARALYRQLVNDLLPRLLPYAIAERLSREGQGPASAAFVPLPPDGAGLEAELERYAAA